MFGHDIPKPILDYIAQHKDVVLYSKYGKLTTETTGAPVARVCIVEDAIAISESNRSRMEQDNLPCVQIEHDLSRCKEFMPARYFENPPYEGRPFIHGLLDCYTLFRDWYANELGIRISWNIQRPYGWWDNNSSLYFQYMKEAGFCQQSGITQRGDVFLFALGGHVTNHVAVYMGEGEILHHLGGRFSCREKLSPALANARTAVCRHKGGL